MAAELTVVAGNDEVESSTSVTAIKVKRVNWKWTPKMNYDLLQMYVSLELYNPPFGTSIFARRRFCEPVMIFFRVGSVKTKYAEMADYLNKVPAYSKDQKFVLTGDKCQQHFKTLEEEFKESEVLRSGQAGSTEPISPVNKTFAEIKQLRDEANAAKATEAKKRIKAIEENKQSQLLYF